MAYLRGVYIGDSDGKTMYVKGDRVNKYGIARIIDNRRKGGKLMCVTTKGRRRCGFSRWWWCSRGRGSPGGLAPPCKAGAALPHRPARRAGPTGWPRQVRRGGRPVFWYNNSHVKNSQKVFALYGPPDRGHVCGLTVGMRCGEASRRAAKSRSLRDAAYVLQHPPLRRCGQAG